MILLAHRAPFEVLDAFDLDTLLVDETHVRQFVDRDSDADVALGNVLVIGRPLHEWPALGSRLVSIRLVTGEGSKRLASLDVPDNVLEALVVGGIESLSDSGDRVVLNVLHGLLGPSDDVVFAWRELHQSDVGMSEPEAVDTKRTVELGSTP